MRLARGEGLDEHLDQADCRSTVCGPGSILLAQKSGRERVSESDLSFVVNDDNALLDTRDDVAVELSHALVFAKRRFPIREGSRARRRALHQGLEHLLHIRFEGAVGHHVSQGALGVCVRCCEGAVLGPHNDDREAWSEAPNVLD